MRRSFLAISMIVSVSGCAPITSSHQTGAADARAAAASSVNKACEAAYADPAAQILRPKIPFKSAEASFPQLSDNSRATKAEQDSLIALEAALLPCLAQQEAYVAQFGATGAYGAYMQFAQESKALRSNLWDRSITFGEFNTRRAAAEAAFRGKLATADSADAARTQSSQPAMAPNYVPPPVVIPPVQFTPMQVPRRTDCQRVGNSMSCTSY